MSIHLQTIDLGKHYSNDRGISNINLKIREGEIFTLLGRNESGKTTFVKSVLGIIKPTCGEVKIFGSADTQKQKERVGFMIEFPVMYLALNARENMEIHRRSIGVKDKGAVNRMLEKVGIKDDTKPLKQTGLPFRERMALGMALMSDPELVILDEPFDEMESYALEEMSQLIKQENEQKNTTFVITSPTLRGLSNITDRYAVIDNGVITGEEGAN